VLVTACVAALVTIAGMVYAFLQRPSARDDAGGDVNLRCGTTVCQSVIGLGVDGDMVEVLTGTGGGVIRVTGDSEPFVFVMAIADNGAKIEGSSALECKPAATAVCLVRGTRGDDLLGEAVVRKAGVWSRVSTPYISTGGYLGLHDVDKDGTADVVVVQLGCDGDCVFTQVFSVVGNDALGCTEPAPSREQANRTPEQAQLRVCTDT
jgi:hypothetical protein